MKYNLHLINQICPKCDKPLLMHGHNIGNGCYGPSVEQMHKSLKANLASAYIIEDYNVTAE